MLYKSLVTKISIPPEKKTKQKEYLEIGLLPIVDQGKEIIGGYTNEVEKNIVCNLPVIVFGDHTCSVKYINFPFGAGADGIKILKAKDNVLPQYLFYGTQYLVFHLHDRGYARHYQHIEKMDLYVPPIEEQRRIVSRIEELFSELDSAVETLQKTRQQLEIYRQAVLKEAFEKIDSEKSCIIETFCEKIVDCPHSTPKWVKEGELCLRTSNFKRGYLDLSEKNYVSKETFDKRNSRLVPKPGDILYSREGAILGIACIIPDNTYVCLGQRMMLFRVKPSMNNYFLMHYLNSYKITSYVKSITGGSASPHINVKDIKNMEIPCPNIDLQNKIVQQIEEKLSTCKSIEEIVEQCSQQAEAMRQSILKKAFEGEL